MTIRTDYTAGEVRTASAVNEENTQILQNIAVDTAFADSWDGDTTHSPSKNAVYDAFKERTMFAGSYVLINGGTSGTFQNVAAYTKRKEIQVFFKGTITVNYSATITGGTLFSRIYVNGSALGTVRTGSGSWTENITVAIGDLVQIYMHDNSTNYPHSITAFNISVSSADTGVVNL